MHDKSSWASATSWKELGCKQEQPTVIQGDNEACIKSQVSGSALKHIKIDHHFVRAHVKEGEIKLIHVTTQDMVADIMTKALPMGPFTQHKDTEVCETDQ